MRFVFVETKPFTRSLPDYFADDAAYQQFQIALVQDPLSGDVLRGCGGLRKVRWSDARRGKGKRGGIRVIYLIVPEVHKIYLLDIYGKDEAEDLDANQRKALAHLAGLIVKEELKRKGVQG